jgi:hypothetical protein
MTWMKIAAGVAISAGLLAVSMAPASARWDHEYHGWHHGWSGGYWGAPPVVYGSPYGYGYYPPPVYYGPSVGVTLPGVSIGIR